MQLWKNLLLLFVIVTQIDWKWFDFTMRYKYCIENSLQAVLMEDTVWGKVSMLTASILSLYWQMCRVAEQNTIALAGGPIDVGSLKNLPPLETVCKDINKILSPTNQDDGTAETPIPSPGIKSEALSESGDAGARVPSTPQDDSKPDNAVNNEGTDVAIESNNGKENGDVEMGETSNDAELDENLDKPDSGSVLPDE